MGKKIGGNAQRYTKEALFQHGSIPISLNDEVFKNIFLEESGLKYIATLDRMGKKLTNKQLTQLLLETFSQSFGVSFMKDTLHPMEQHSISKLLIHKYNLKSWNIDRSL